MGWMLQGVSKMETTQTKFKWFWPWQDEKEEAWLEAMSAESWHLSSVGLMGRYTFTKGEARPYNYRLDFMLINKGNRAEYLQIYQDAGWVHIGEMSNWQYWRKPVVAGETHEIFTDTDSKIKKYRRLLLFMAFMLVVLVFLGRSMFVDGPPYTDLSSIVNLIYFTGRLLYAIIIPVYIVVVVKLAQRINQLKKKAV
jgi:hypothetical protein